MNLCGSVSEKILVVYWKKSSAIILKHEIFKTITYFYCKIDIIIS